MICYHRLWLLIFIFSPAAYAQTTDKYTDENRPYKFGFNIEGYQHRQEQKDERGIIKGEYGFITADGYYRVTVYATDENGDFRIISMKNYYVGFPPEDPTTTPGSPTSRQGGAGLKPFGATGERSDEGDRGLIGSSPPQKEPVKPQGKAACSSCFIPTTPKPSFGFASGGVGGDSGGANFIGGPETGSGRRQEKFPGPINLNSIPDSPNAPPRSNFEQGKTSQLDSGAPRSGKNFESFGDPRSPNNYGTPGNADISGTPGSARIPGNAGFSGTPGSAGIPGNAGFSGTPGSAGIPGNAGFSGTPGSAGISGNAGFSGAPRNAGILGTSGPRDSQYPSGNGPENPNIPGSVKTGQVRGQFDNLQNNGPNNRKPQIGEVRDGLPPGVSLDAVKDLLLYTFNYTVGFHGHHEDGYRSGDKEGDYFFDGRDGVERQVKYLANEFGYQPNITLIDLQENDVRKPKEETEKEYGLKGYEFKWFYRK